MDPYEENVDSLVDHTEEVTASQAAVPEVLKDADVLLIETVAAYPALYDKQVKEYHASDIRQNCWGMVAAVTNTSGIMNGIAIEIVRNATHDLREDFG